MNCLIVTNLCFGSVRPYSTIACTNPYVAIDNIVKVSNGFDYCFIVNDVHEKDDVEFDYIPPHMVKGGSDVARLHHYDRRLKSKHIQFLNKNTMSAIGLEHNRQTILNNNFSEIAVAGFCASTDIISTCLSLIDYKQKIVILPACIDDVLDEFRSKALSYLNYIGIKSMDV